MLERAPGAGAAEFRHASHSSVPGTWNRKKFSALLGGYASACNDQWGISWRVIPERMGSTKSSTNSKRAKRKNVRHVHDGSISKVRSMVTSEHWYPCERGAARGELQAREWVRTVQFSTGGRKDFSDARSEKRSGGSCFEWWFMDSPGIWSWRTRRPRCPQRRRQLQSR